MTTIRKVSTTEVKVRVTQFQVVHFKDNKGEKKNGASEERDVLILYGLGEDGIIYEYGGGTWLALPITKDNIRINPL